MSAYQNLHQENLRFFTENLSKKPYCTDWLEFGLAIRNAATAQQKRYIQHNQPNSKIWLAYDIDRGIAPEEITDDLLLPPPTLFIQNPENKHAHALYGLTVPVHLNNNSSQAAIRLAGAIDCAMQQRLDADAGYVGLITKNPKHEDWLTYSLASTYELCELADYLDLSAYNDPKAELPAYGLGRNCRLFDKLRVWAYRAIRQGWPAFDQWHNACLDRCVAYNAQFGAPLPYSEVKATAKSVAKWTYKKFDQKAFVERQTALGKLSGKARLAASSEKRAQAQEMASRGMTQKEIAEVLGVSRMTISRWFRCNMNHIR